MKRYKNLDELEKKCIENNGKAVEVWDDDGIMIDGKIYRMFEYGDISGHQYCTFCNRGRGKKIVCHEYYEDGEYITIEYYLRRGLLKGSKPKYDRETHYLFEFILIREWW